MLIMIIRKFFDILKYTPESFLQHVVNERIEGLSTKASALLMTRYKELAYFQSDDVEEIAFISRIMTRTKVVHVDISPLEDLVICEYQNKGIELFSLLNSKPLWKIDDIVAKRRKKLCVNGKIIDPPRCIVFHPLLNIIFPGQLNPVLNLRGKFESGPITCGKNCTKFVGCCFSHDKTKLVTQCDNLLMVWNLRDNEKIVTLSCQTRLYSILFSGNDRYIATTEPQLFTVYDTENGYCKTERHCSSFPEVIVSTFKFDSWYCSDFSGFIVKHDLTIRRFRTDYLLSPLNARAMVEFQAIMENENPMWFQKLGSRGNFFILGNGNVLFYKCNKRELKIFQMTELIRGSALKQEYDKRRLTSFFLGKKNAIISENGKYIYTISPYFDSSNTILSSTRPGKSWKLVQVDHSITPLLSVTNGVLLIKRNVEGSTPELWNADLTECLFKFSELTGTFRCFSVTENLVACVLRSEVRFFDVFKKESIACTQLPQHNSSELSGYEHSDNIIACGRQYHVVYTKNQTTLLLQKKNVVDLSKKRVLINLRPSVQRIHTACFSLDGGLLAFSSGDNMSIHILDISTYKIRCNIPMHIRVQGLEFFDEEYLLCRGSYCLCLIEAKTWDIISSIDVAVDYLVEWNFSVSRKTGEIVVCDRNCRTFQQFKLWLPHQRNDENELLESCSLTHAANATTQQSKIV